jgi:hypothetical protein
MLRAIDIIESLQAHCAEAEMRAHQWMQAHDKLKAGKPYDLPKPSDLPEAIESLQAEVGHYRTTLDEIAYANWPSVNGDNPVDRIKALARQALAAKGETPDAAV